MNTGGKIVVTLGIASSALFAAWLLTGPRKIKTKQFVARKAITIKDAVKSQRVVVSEDQEVYYI